MVLCQMLRTPPQQHCAAVSWGGVFEANNRLFKRSFIRVICLAKPAENTNKAMLHFAQPRYSLAQTRSLVVNLRCTAEKPYLSTMYDETNLRKCIFYHAFAEDLDGRKTLFCSHVL